MRDVETGPLAAVISPHTLSSDDIITRLRVMELLNFIGNRYGRGVNNASLPC